MHGGWLRMRMASLLTLQTKIEVYDTQYIGLGEIRLSLCVTR